MNVVAVLHLMPYSEISGMAISDTDLRGGSGFPVTSWSLISGSRDPSSPEAREHLERLLQSYWRPVFRTIRARWKHSVEDAKDLTQGFFITILEGPLLERFQPDKGRFRTFLKASLENFLLSDHQRRGRLKRGGGRKIFSLDLDEGQLAETIPAETPEESGAEFDREWARSVIQDALRSVEEQFVREGKKKYLEAFRLYEVDAPTTERPTYAQVARTLGIRETDVDNYLSAVRKAVHAAVVERIRETVSSPEQLRQELDELLSF